MKKNIFLLLIVSIFALNLFSQERVVYVDFVSSSFKNNPTIPFDQPFNIQGEVFKDVEFVEVVIFNENSSKPFQTFTWNRVENNSTETFSIVVPGVLRSNSKYDIEIKTYKLISFQQKTALTANLRNRIQYYLLNNYVFDGKSVTINNPKKVYNGLKTLIDEGFTHFRSKNSIELNAPSALVLSEMEKQSEFRFKDFLKKKKKYDKDSLANILIDEKVNYLIDMIMAEIQPFINTELVQHHRQVFVKSISTDKETFTLPVNFGMYAWNKNVNINNTNVRNINFTPGIGFTIPFSSKSTIMSKSRFVDSFGFSAGLLLKSVKDANGTSYVTPGINLPVYAGLGIRFFKVVRFNVGILVLAEKGIQDFSKLSILPTAGLALELDLWMGIKK